jgi:hypothetical protein
MLHKCAPCRVLLLSSVDRFLCFTACACLGSIAASVVYLPSAPAPGLLPHRTSPNCRLGRTSRRLAVSLKGSLITGRAWKAATSGQLRRLPQKGSSIRVTWIQNDVRGASSKNPWCVTVATAVQPAVKVVSTKAASCSSHHSRKRLE